MFGLISLFSASVRRLGTVKADSAATSFLPAMPQCMRAVKACVPELSPTKHKGEAGRIAVIGGSEEYTGAPYFAGISALKTGADLSSIICEKSAASVIKSYSPDLIVYPLLDDASRQDEIMSVLDRVHSVVVGPGLGRKSSTLDRVAVLIEAIKERNLPLVIDADGLYLITQKPELIRDYEKVVITPNAVEFARLYKAVMGKECVPGAAHIEISQLAVELDITILRKDLSDIIACKDIAVDVARICYLRNETSWRRCGGQGDILSGALAAFLYWAFKTESLRADKGEFPSGYKSSMKPTEIACYGAATLTRECNRRAYKKHGRSMLAADMIVEIGSAFHDLFEEEDWSGTI